MNVTCTEIMEIKVKVRRIIDVSNHNRYRASQSEMDKIKPVSDRTIILTFVSIMIQKGH